MGELIGGNMNKHDWEDAFVYGPVWRERASFFSMLHMTAWHSGFRHMMDNVRRFDECFPNAATPVDDQPYMTLTDVGCGRGATAHEFAMRGMGINVCDIAKNALSEVMAPPYHENFIHCPVWALRAELAADYMFCAEVLQSVPEFLAIRSLVNLLIGARRGVYISVQTTLDDDSAPYGKEFNGYGNANINVKPAAYWNNMLVCAMKEAERLNANHGIRMGYELNKTFDAGKIWAAGVTVIQRGD